MADPNRSWALRLAEAGISVFPCGPDKRALVKWRDASTTDAEQLAQWWHQWPNALPAIDLDKSDLVVLDGDRHGGADGRTALRELLQQKGCNTSGAPIVLTPRDGVHVYFKQNGHKLGNSSGDLPEGIDVRGQGGYVIAYAVLPDGRQYKAAASSPDLITAFQAGTIPLVPQLIDDLIQAPKRKHAEQPHSKPANTASNFGDTREQAYAAAALNGCVAELAAMGKDTGRNNKLNALAFRLGRMIARGWIDRTQVETALTGAMHANGYSAEEGDAAVRATLRSGIDDGTADPHPDLPDREDHGGSGNTTSGDSASAAEKPKAEPVKILSSAEFISSYVAPDYLIEGLLQRQFFYSLTGKTGGGKTAIALLFAALVALGRTMDGKEFFRGRVLYLAGENPVDILQRWIAMAQQMDFDGNTIDVHFIPGVFSVSGMADCIAKQVEALGGVSLVIIDTTAAYFEGDDENSNVQAGKYARMQRGLVSLPGGPTILALCHPVKNAQDDNLLPRGGGAYLNESDGNLTTQINSGVAQLHWQGKFRGPDFAPMSFLLRTVTHERLKDSKGRLIPTVVASHLSETGEQEIKATARSNEDKLLTILATNKGASIADLAKLGEWLQRDGGPNKTLVWRLVKSLKGAKLVSDGRNGLELTDAGKKAVKTAP